jgi:hypothetical protein
MLPQDQNQLDITENVFKYADHVNDVGLLQYPPSQFVHVNMPLKELTCHLSVSTLQKMARLHNCYPGAHSTKKTLEDALHNHSCPQCNVLLTVLSIEACHTQCCRTNKRKQVKENNEHKNNIDTPVNATDDLQVPFPPEPLTERLAQEIVAGACNKMSIPNLEEGGCAVCGELVPVGQLSRLKAIKNHLHVLKADGVTSIERKYLTDKKKEYTGPVLDYRCCNVCNSCCMSLRANKVPKLALA